MKIKQWRKLNRYLEVASCKLHMPWFWMNVLSFPLTSLVWLECSSKLVRYIIALCIGIYVVFLQFCYAKLRRLRLNCNCTVTDSETIWRKQLLCCFHTLCSNLFWILISNLFSSDRDNFFYFQIFYKYHVVYKKSIF